MLAVEIAQGLELDTQEFEKTLFLYPTVWSSRLSALV